MANWCGIEGIESIGYCAAPTIKYRGSEFDVWELEDYLCDNMLDDMNEGIFDNIVYDEDGDIDEHATFENYVKWRGGDDIKSILDEWLECQIDYIQITEDAERAFEYFAQERGEFDDFDMTTTYLVYFQNGEHIFYDSKKALNEGLDELKDDSRYLGMGVVIDTYCGVVCQGTFGSDDFAKAVKKEFSLDDKKNDIER